MFSFPRISCKNGRHGRVLVADPSASRALSLVLSQRISSKREECVCLIYRVTHKIIPNLSVNNIFNFHATKVSFICVGAAVRGDVFRWRMRRVLIKRETYWTFCVQNARHNRHLCRSITRYSFVSAGFLSTGPRF